MGKVTYIPRVNDREVWKVNCVQFKYPKYTGIRQHEASQIVWDMSLSQKAAISRTSNCLINLRKLKGKVCKKGKKIVHSKQ